MFYIFRVNIRIFPTSAQQSALNNPLPCKKSKTDKSYVKKIQPPQYYLPLR